MDGFGDIEPASRLFVLRSWFQPVMRNRHAVLSVIALTLLVAPNPATAATVCTFACVTTNADTGNVHLSTSAALLDLSNQFLRRLGNEATSAFAGAPLAASPTGGGADTSIMNRYRAWFEGYGLASRTDARDDFAGDRRRTWGGVAGLGVNVVPGASIGFSVDQSHTKIDVSTLPQSATVNLTQIGVNAALESGSWALSIAAIYGFGGVHSRRDDISGIDRAAYGAAVWGALAELSYLWASGNARIVPKIGIDWARTRTDAFTETGSAGTVSGGGQISHRTRGFVGAEIGNTWIVDHIMYDLSGYGRLVDIFSQDVGALQVSGSTGATTPRLIQGVAESKFGADAGAVATMRLSALARIYAAYDGRFRGNFTAHSGTMGIELRW